ncbi:TPA: trypsin-like serine protease [Klebsiella pneumoniae]|nr:trypsin-like serine protease [Klebsiella pneumoniae]
MLENYVCKIYVSKDPSFSKNLEATAFGFNDKEQLKVLTAAHVVTDALGKEYPSSNTQKLYVIFHNHLGPVNTVPVPVDFILNNCNDSNNFKDNYPFVDSAEMKLPANIKQPVSQYFKARNPKENMHTFGVGYPLDQTVLSTVFGKIQSIFIEDCENHRGQHYTSRFVISHNNRQGCSGGPYIISDGDEYYVIGSLIGEMFGIKEHSCPTLSVQSSADF